jgi:hypothetical protein
VALERVPGYAEKDVDQPVVAKLGKQRLFIVERIRGDDLGRSVGDFDHNEIGIGHKPTDRGLPEPILRSARWFDNPLQTLLRAGQNIFRQALAISKGVDEVAKVLGVS